MRDLHILATTFKRSIMVFGMVLALIATGAAMDQHTDKKDQPKDKMGKMEAKKETLYKRLGQKKGITVVVNDFVANVGGDKRINGFFAKTVADPKRLANFKKLLVDQICEASGGPCKYKGKDMKTAHKGMGVRDADFTALVEDLVKALDKNKVGQKEKDELLAALGPMKGDIVEK